ncbi:uncharacterized protein RJT21DRAFT_1955 [Scheffersomyces amazonensis]|uniref:uncharacterized protein n=1 Tax=Scheffersomyces amazonensis TaxID=1078765 RepID=UPI00315D0180
MSDSEDSSIDTNEYSIQDYYKLIRPLWAAKNINASYLNNHKLLRTLVDFSLTHSLFLKNLQKRELDLGDIIPTKINYINSLVIRTPNHNNLNNQDHPYQYYGCFRNKYVEFCPHLAIAAYLFTRFHIPDEYGSLEFIFNENHKLNLQDVKLLKGNNKLSAISYSQQHKSSINALGLSGLNYKDINLNKLLSIQGFEVVDKLVSLDIEQLPHKLMLELADPPQELLDQIFPFINQIDPVSESSAVLRMKQLLTILRRSLVQDMVIIKHKYPNNPISKHALFNSELFNKFSNDMEKNGVFTDSPSFEFEDDDELDADMEDSDNYESLINNPNVDLSKIVEIQNNKVKNLQDQLNNIYMDQKNVFENLNSFIEVQNEVFHRQAEHLQKISNSINGLMVLLSTRNKNLVPLAQQSLGETAEFINSISSSNVKQGLNNTLDLLTKLSTTNASQYVSFPNPTNSIYNTLPSPTTKNGTSATHSPIAPTLQPIQHHLYPHQPFSSQHVHQHQHIHHHPPTPSTSSSSTSISQTLGPQLAPQTPLTPQQIERQTILNRRLSRQATTLFEMWDDFKGLEQALKDHEITVTEWLKVHGSSERQFRHTRLKIIKFIEDEAARRNCSVEIVKEKLHSKMRNRLRPWTLDEVQRMLTSGKRINLNE